MSTIKQKTKKIILNSTDSDEESEHELIYFANDRIRLMKEVLKLLKPKKIKAIAPDFMKHLDMDETNSILLEELLGISNKRLKHILNGDNVDIVSTSSDSEAEQVKPIDVISLDDISDTDDEFGLAGVNSTHEKYVKNKITETNNKKLMEVKTEKGEHSKKKEIQSKDKPANESDKLINVLEILELQARARAIRSQLALENVNKNTVSIKKTEMIEDDDDTAIILSSPKNEEIVITSSESEDENCRKRKAKINKENYKKSVSKISEISVSNLTNNEDKSTRVHKENSSSSKPVEDNTSESNKDKQSEQPANKDLAKESTQVESSTNMKNNDSNASLNNNLNRDSVCEDKNQTSYKSDSDNDIINLDSEDIEIK